MTALTPAEALVLLDPAEASGIDAVKVTVLSLLALGFLRTGTQAAASMFGRARQVPTLSPGRPYPFLPSEPFTVGSDTVKVRARWTVEGVSLRFP